MATFPSLLFISLIHSCNRCRLADAATTEGESKLASEYLEEALSVRRNHLPANHRLTANVHMDLYLVYADVSNKATDFPTKVEFLKKGFFTFVNVSK